MSDRMSALKVSVHTCCPSQFSLGPVPTGTTKT